MMRKQRVVRQLMTRKIPCRGKGKKEKPNKKSAGMSESGFEIARILEASESPGNDGRNKSRESARSPSGGKVMGMTLRPRDPASLPNVRIRRSQSKLDDFVPVNGPKPKRYIPGYLAVQEIRRYQRTTELLIPKLSFQRLVKGVMSILKSEYRFQAAALNVLQEAAEAYVVRLYENVNFCCVHARRVTIRPQDVSLAQRIRGDY